MSDQPVDLQKLWARVIATVKKGDIIRSLWDAVEAARPIVIEDETLVIGFSPVNMRHSSYLTQPGNEGVVRRAIEAAAGRRLEMQIIEGDNLEAWERYKQRRQTAADQTEQVARVAVGHRNTTDAWLQLSQQVQRMYYEIAGREQALGHARYLVKAIPLIARTEQQLRSQAPEADDVHEIELNRVFDRISSLSGLPGGIIALEYLRYVDSRKRG